MNSSPKILSENFETEVKKAEVISNKFIDLTMFGKSLDQYHISNSLDAVGNQLIDKINEIVYIDLKDKDLLGLTISDSLGTTIAINSKLRHKNHDPRLGFTIAHEIGHVVSEHPINRSFTIKKDLYEKTWSYERTANIFAANLLLPFDVLLSQVLKGFIKKQIVKISQVSYEMLEVRILEILERRFGLLPYEAKLVSNEYLQCAHQRQVRHSTLYKFFVLTLRLI